MGKYFIVKGNFQNMNLILFGVPDFIVIYYLLLIWFEILFQNGFIYQSTR